MKSILIELTAPDMSVRRQRGSLPQEQLALDRAAIALAIGHEVDKSFFPVALPIKERTPQGVSEEDDSPTCLLRVFVDRSEPIEHLRRRLSEVASFRQVYADPVFGVQSACLGDVAIGAWTDVRTRMGGERLADDGFDGRGVSVAVIDSGVNFGAVRRTFADVSLDPDSLVTLPPAPAAGNQIPAHGTMCAFDAAILAPRMSILDCPVALSGSSGQALVAGLVSDTILAFSHLLTLIVRLPSHRRRLVVNNSWGVLDPEWDAPRGDPGNYSDNPYHPIFKIVSALGREGADVVFAAGNCGRRCRDPRCNFGDDSPIAGANASPDVLTVGAACLDDRIAGYSSNGPGRIAADKPDVVGYTHFAGSGIFPPADGGTSAACGVISGLVAALRTWVSSAAISPSALRDIIRSHSTRPGGSGYDASYGWGMPDVPSILDEIMPLAGSHQQ